MRRSVRFKGIKATPKGLEKDLLEKSRRLAEDPSALMPKCEQGCRKCPFDKLLKKMEKVQRYADDAEALIGLAAHGDQLVRAYAATISLAASGKIPFLTVRKLPSGDVSFAVRGKVDAEKLIGVQYFDDPDLRLLAFWEIARDKDLHLYSEEQGLKCSDGPSAPAQFVLEALKDAPYELAPDNSCGHPQSPLALVIGWRSADKTISICSDCAGDANLLHDLTSRIAARDPADDFTVDVHYSPHCVGHADCATKAPFSMSSQLRHGYQKGEVNDAALIDRYLTERKVALRRTSGELYILGKECYGKDKEAFFKALKGSDAEVVAISGLARSKPLVVISPSEQTAKVLTELWTENREVLLGQVASAEVWRPLLESGGNMPPGMMIQEAYRLHRSKEISDKLPRYSSRGSIGTLADDMARAFKTEGKAGMLRLVDKARPKEHRGKALVYGFLTAVGEAEGRGWQFTAEEKDFGKYLAGFAKVLLESEPSKYDDALRTLLTASGASEELVLAT